MYRKAWKPSKTVKREFAEKMREIENFCAKNGIHSSLSNDSYYFTVDGINYRISNHSVEASNRGAFDETTGENCIIKTAGKITRFISMQARQESLRFTMILWQDINWTAEETERTGCNEFS